MDIEQKLRKLKHTLYCDGLGVIMLGGWSVLKVVMSVLGGQDMFHFDEIDIDPENMLLLKIFSYIFLAVGVLVIFLFHYYIGKRAMNVGKKDSKKRLFLIPTGLYCISNSWSIPFSIEALRDNNESLDTLIVSLLIDIIFSFLLLDIIVLTIRVGKMQKKLRLREGE